MNSVQSVLQIDRTIFYGVYRRVLLNDELSNLSPISYGALARSKWKNGALALDANCLNTHIHMCTPIGSSVHDCPVNTNCTYESANATLNAQTFNVVIDSRHHFHYFWPVSLFCVSLLNPFAASVKWLSGLYHFFSLFRRLFCSELSIFPTKQAAEHVVLAWQNDTEVWKLIAFSKTYGFLFTLFCLYCSAYVQNNNIALFQQALFEPPPE